MWVTRYLNEDRKLMQYSIKIDIRDLSKYEVSEDIELDQTLYSTGTDVKFSNINKLSVLMPHLLNTSLNNMLGFCA